MVPQHLMDHIYPNTTNNPIPVLPKRPSIQTSLKALGNPGNRHPEKHPYPGTDTNHHLLSAPSRQGHPFLCIRIHRKLGNHPHLPQSYNKDSHTIHSIHAVHHSFFYRIYEALYRRKTLFLPPMPGRLLLRHAGIFVYRYDTVPDCTS